ncbi:MAG: DNA repair protein RecO [Syntrophobacterales bacterium]|nr:DNA repair protein RecO [Syntrophobacterales bacterium]
MLHNVPDGPIAMVLAVKELGGADLLVFFLDRTGTLKRGLAKNAKKSMRRFINCLEPLNLVTLTYAPAHSQLLLKEAQLEVSFPALRKDPLIMGIGNLMAELLLAFIPENDPHEESFMLTLEALKQLNNNRPPLLIASIWILRLMLITGYLPNFNKCTICNADLEQKKRWVWQVEPPRCVCADHHLSGDLKWEWDLEVLMFLRSLQTLPLSRIWRLGLSTTKIGGLFKNISRWCEAILQKEIRSYKWLERIIIKPQ